LFIMSREAANDIRSGLSDVAMMRKYGISARVLEKLFKKLIDKGEIESSEIEKRMRLAERSHVVDLVTFTVAELKKTRVNAREAVSCIRSGMSDIELMEKYNISAQGLESLFSKLIEAQEIGRSELESRKHAMEWAEIAFASGSDQPEQFLQDFSTQELDKQEWLRQLQERHKVLIAGITGAVLGAMAVAAVAFLVRGAARYDEASAPPPAMASSVNSPGEGVHDQTQGVIQILKDIHAYHGGSGVNDHVTVSPYEECLKRCESEFDPRDQTERPLFFNCKKSCLQEHSARFRGIRRQFHVPPSVRAR